MTPRQLSLDVELERDADRPDQEPGSYLTGSLKIGGDFYVAQDLNMGEKLTVTVANADGLVISQGVVRVGPVGFEPILDHGIQIGVNRAHKAKLQ